MRRIVVLPILSLLLGFGAGLAIVEGALRLAGYANPSTSQRDDFCGTIRRPGVEYFQADEGRAWVRFNAAGFRDDEWALEKAGNTYRIAVLGDSYVEAVQVSADARFTEILERELDGSPTVAGRRVEVLTFGVSGFGTAQELMCLRGHVWAYSPDMVILAVTTGNDVRNNSRALQKDNGRPYFTYVDGTLTLDDSFRQSPAHRRAWLKNAAVAIVDRSRTAQLAYSWWQTKASAARRALIREAAAAARTGDEPGLDSWIYAPPDDPVHEEAWRITEDLLALMHREVTARGARFLAVTLSNGVQVHPDQEVRRAFMQRAGVEDLFYPERRIQAAGERHGFAVLSLAPALLDHAASTGVFLHGFDGRLGSGHWNETGHREAGKRLAAHVRRLLDGGEPGGAAGPEQGARVMTTGGGPAARAGSRGGA